MMIWMTGSFCTFFNFIITFRVISCLATAQFQTEKKHGGVVDKYPLIIYRLISQYADTQNYTFKLTVFCQT